MLTHAERGRMGGRARQDAMTAEERSALGRRAYLAGAVKAVVDRAPELTPEQLSKLRTLFNSGLSQHPDRVYCAQCRDWHRDNGGRYVGCTHICHPGLPDEQNDLCDARGPHFHAGAVA